MLMTGRVRFIVQEFGAEQEFGAGQEFELREGQWTGVPVDEDRIKLMPAEADDARLAELRAAFAPWLGEAWGGDGSRHIEWAPAFTPWGNYADLQVRFPITLGFRWEQIAERFPPDLFRWIPDDRVLRVIIWWRQPRGMATMSGPR
jgi:hypothetical protein